jgi:hypothetical protein
MGAYNDKDIKPCDICKALELPNAHSHSTEMCFGNPSNPNCKPTTFATRFK